MFTEIAPELLYALTNNRNQKQIQTTPPQETSWSNDLRGQIAVLLKHGLPYADLRPLAQVIFRTRLV